jgi:hypothetical protein
MTLTRGGPANGAWSASVSGLGSRCRGYVFEFGDASGAYCTAGSLSEPEVFRQVG